MALDPIEPWEYFGGTQTAALEALRARLGASYATSPDDAALLLLLRRAVAYLHDATGRWFVQRWGSIRLDGTDAAVLWLPHPVVSTDQGGSGVIAVRLVDDTEDLDPTSYVAVDGAHLGADDPRQNPRIERVTRARTSAPPIEYGRAGVWPAGVQNVEVTATWGYLEEDGSTPELILHALARLVVWVSASPDDLESIEDRKRAGLVFEQVRGRSYSLAAHAAGAGLTLDREIDLILRGYRRPAEVRVSRPPRRASRSRYFT